MKMIQGIIETESLKDKSLIEQLKPRKTVVEHHPDSNTSTYWHCNLIQLPDELFVNLQDNISTNLIGGWFAIFWNDNYFTIIFKNKLFNLARNFLENDSKPVIEYGLKHGVQKKYLDFNNEVEKYKKYLND